MAGQLTVSNLRDDTGVLASQNGMTGIAKAWLNYNGSSQSINGSFNVSSVTRSSAGNYIVNFTTSMPNANYAVTMSNNNTVQNIANQWQWYVINSASAVNIRIFQGGEVDASSVSVAIFSS